MARKPLDLIMAGKGLGSCLGTAGFSGLLSDVPSAPLAQKRAEGLDPGCRQLNSGCVIPKFKSHGGRRVGTIPCDMEGASFNAVGESA